MKIISYSGPVDMDVVVEFLKELRGKINDKKTLSTLTKIYVELVQNIQFYSDEVDQDMKGVGSFTIKRENELYIAEFSNLVKEDKKNIIENQFNQIMNMDKQGRKEFKINLLKKTNNDKGNIGLLRVIEESEENTSISFRKTDDISYFYSIESKIRIYE